ncbi:MAG TPA: hypothetical protein VGY97_07590 [Solirubrobacteraceae bacterium]|nr:hypothetical protein [Solirubrobacteraceae bacterium]
MALAALVSGCGAGQRHARPAASGPRSPATHARAPRPAPPPRALAIGLTEANPDLLWAPQARAHVPAGLQLWRERLLALRPDYVRIHVDWSQVQPRADTPPRWDAPQSGCQRGEPPCVPYRGIAEELAAIASEQRVQSGFVPVVDLSGVPAWAARGPSGCEPPGIQPRSRAIAPTAIPAYRALISSLLELGRRYGLALPYWSPWNEPNHPFFLSPQRARCSRAAPTVSPHIYAELVRAMASELAAAPGEHHLVLGELAGIPHSGGPHSTGIPEFVRALPRDVVCASNLWAVHDYARAGGAAGAPDSVRRLERALAERAACARHARIWITETGDGSPHLGHARSAVPRDRRAGCRALAGALVRWSRDSRVKAVFQYTFREDSAFPVGLADERLTALRPAYYLWSEWARAPSRKDPPGPPAQCA